MGRYTSTGTVKVQWFRDNNGDVEVFFVPDHSHSIRRDGSCYAVFVEDNPASSDAPELRARTLDKEYDSNSGKSVRLLAPDCSRMYGALANASAAQCKIKVGIKYKGGETDFKLDRITVPSS